MTATNQAALPAAPRRSWCGDPNCQWGGRSHWHDDSSPSPNVQKPRYSLVPATALASVTNVLTRGAIKHGDETWRERVAEDAGTRTYLDKAMRHIEEYRFGRKADHETGQHPLAHAICDLMFILEREEGGVAVVEGRCDERA